MRIFKTKHFARFATSERISDSLLGDAIRRAEAGLIDADIGLAAKMLALDVEALARAIGNGTITEID